MGTKCLEAMRAANEPGLGCAKIMPARTGSILVEVIIHLPELATLPAMRYGVLMQEWVDYVI